MLGAAFPELKEYFASQNPQRTIKKYRNEKGGSVLFRPVGLTIFTHVVEAAAKGRELKEAVAKIRKLPTQLSKRPYVDLLWNPTSQTLDLRRQVLVRRLLLYMLGEIKGPRKIAKLKADLAKTQGIAPDHVKLPEVV